MTWRETDRRARLLALALGTLFGLYFGLYGVAILQGGGPYPFGDFFALWSDGRIAAAHPAAELYDPASLLARQIALGGSSTGSTPFPYPPSFIAVVWPLGLLSYWAAFVVFMAATMALYALAIVLPRPRLPLTLVAITAPTSILTLVAGQTGFLAAGLFLGGMRLAPARPILGGILLGLLAYKPQLGLMVPVALVAAGHWRAIASACITVAVVALASAAAFGWHIWADWLAYLPAYSAQFARESGEITFLMPTPTAALRMLGAAPSIIPPAQAIIAVGCAVWAWRACRGGLSPRALLVLVVATFLAAPYAFIYDLPLLTGAVLLFIADRSRAPSGLSSGEVAALTLALVFPAIMPHTGGGVPVGAPCLALLAAVLIAPTPATPTPGRPAARA